MRGQGAPERAPPGTTKSHGSALADRRPKSHIRTRPGRSQTFSCPLSSFAEYRCTIKSIRVSISGYQFGATPLAFCGLAPAFSPQGLCRHLSCLQLRPPRPRTRDSKAKRGGRSCPRLAALSAPPAKASRSAKVLGEAKTPLYEPTRPANFPTSLPAASHFMTPAPAGSTMITRWTTSIASITK